MLNNDERPSLVQLRIKLRDLWRNLHKEPPQNTPFWEKWENFGNLGKFGRNQKKIAKGKNLVKMGKEPDSVVPAIIAVLF